MNPISKNYSLYEELPEPIYQSWLAIERKERLVANLTQSLHLQDSKDEREKIQKRIDELLKVS